MKKVTFSHTFKNQYINKIVQLHINNIVISLVYDVISVHKTINQFVIIILSSTTIFGARQKFQKYKIYIKYLVYFLNNLKIHFLHAAMNLINLYIPYIKCLLVLCTCIAYVCNDFKNYHHDQCYLIARTRLHK